MARHNLTTRFVESVDVTDRTDFWDDKTRGLVLRVSPSGVKTWSLVYTSERDGKKQRLKLGRFPALGLNEARSAALRQLTAIVDGADPAAQRRSDISADTVRELGAEFIDKYAKPNKRTWASDERVLEKDVYPHIGEVKLSKLTRADVRRIVDLKADAGHRQQGRIVLATVRKMLNWAVEKDIIEVSPAIGIKPPIGIVRRDRVLSKDELARLLKALPGTSLAAETKAIIELLLLTGQRVGEVCGMVRGEIDLAGRLWTLPGARTKNGLTHVVPLSDPALAIVERYMAKADDRPNAPLFSIIGEPLEPRSISQATRKHLQLFDERWTPHDLRRSAATHMAETGILPHVIEAALNHISGFRSGVAGTYNRAAYAPEKRQAMDRWADHVMALKDGTASNVVALRAGA